MTVVANPIDAVGGSPQYAAQDERAARSVLYGAGSGRVLGARSGLRVGTPAVLSVVGSSWRVAICSGVLDPKVQTFAGPYNWAITAQESGALAAADASNPRIDAVYLRIKDNAIDVGGQATAVVEYKAGTPNASPARPTVMADGSTALTQAHVFGWITVPAAGGGTPTVVQNRRFTASAGGVLPVLDSSDYPTASTELKESGLQLYDIALDTYLKCTGTAWKRIVPQRQLQADTVAVTTNASGNGTITFPTGFQDVPDVVASPATGAGGFSSVIIGTRAATLFTFAARNNAGTGMANANLVVAYHALGSMS